MSSQAPGGSPAPTPPVTPPPPANTTSPPPPSPSASPPPPPTPTAPPPATPSPPAPVAPVASPPPPDTPAPSTSPPPAPTTPISPPPSSPSPPSSVPVTPSPPLPPSTRTPPSPPNRSAPPPPRGVNNPPASPSPSSESSGISTGVVVAIAIGGVLLLAVLTICFVFCKKKRRRSYYLPPPPQPKVDPYGGRPQHWQQNAPPPGEHHITMPPPKPTPPPVMGPRTPHSPVLPPPPPPAFLHSSSGGSGSGYSDGSAPFSHGPLPPPAPGIPLGFSKSTFTYEELSMATDGFSDANLLGQGGFGFVHRGVLPNGKEVAVKRLKAGSGQGEREFQAEVEIISRVHHKHLVSLVGYCMAGAQRMLVYEFVPNNNLEFHLHEKNRPVMDFSTRLRIALGSAKGLAYLHEDCHPKIIHRDIKAANILLDFNFEAKVADFGLAKITSDVATHVSTRVMGTFGYLAPEYAASGKLTEKSDVFSFGIMLLELITGRRPVDSGQTFMDDSLVDWARPLLTRAMEEGDYSGLVDPRLQEYNRNEAARMVSCAAACVRHSARRRPRMSQVVRALEGDVSLSVLNEAKSSMSSSDYDAMQHNEEVAKFRKTAFGTQGFADNEQSGSSGEVRRKQDSLGFNDGPDTQERKNRYRADIGEGF